MATPEDLKVIASLRDEITATLAVSVLENHGIHGVVFDGAQAGHAGLSNIFPVRVAVAEKDVEEARGILTDEGFL